MSCTDYVNASPAVLSARATIDAAQVRYRRAGRALDMSECDCGGARCRKVCEEYRAEQAMDAAYSEWRLAESALAKAQNAAALRYC
tara:strand:- start:46536 stop:46793 length:258 start_codon:yes stop_codon:yes gene_type:complete